MGLKDLLRSRSKSRTRASQETQRPSFDTSTQQQSPTAATAAAPPVPVLSEETIQRHSVDAPRAQHTLRHQPEVSNLHNQSMAQDSRGRATQQQTQPNSWASQTPINLTQPLRFGGDSHSDRSVDQQLSSKMASMTMSNGSNGMATSARTAQQPSTTEHISKPLPKEPSSAETGTWYDAQELTPFATPMLEKSLDSVNPFVQAEVKPGPQNAYTPGVPMMVKGAKQPPDLRGIVDLRNTEDTTVEVKTAPTVVHELVKPEVHHIRHEVITREIHTHEYFHRILPIIDVEVLPARHFVRSKANPEVLEEVPPESLPHSVIDKYNNYNWVIAETVSNPSDTPLPGPRRFTAKEFKGTEGDYEEWTDANGTKRTKTTWVYPPEIDDTLYKQGLTQPVGIHWR